MVSGNLGWTQFGCHYGCTVWRQEDISKGKKQVKVSSGPSLELWTLGLIQKGRNCQKWNRTEIGGVRRQQMLKKIKTRDIITWNNSLVGSRTFYMIPTTVIGICELSHTKWAHFYPTHIIQAHLNSGLYFFDPINLFRL